MKRVIGRWITPIQLTAILAAFTISCGRSPTANLEDTRAKPADKTLSAPREGLPSPSEATPAQATLSEWGARGASAHRVVFADRSSQGYLLLLPNSAGDTVPTGPTRETLGAWVNEAFKGHTTLEEVMMLQRLIESDAEALEAITPLSNRDLDPDDPAAMRREAKAGDIIGLHTAVLKTRNVADLATLQDPILSRYLSAGQRESLATRPYALLLRADYRAREAFRGLRLLQALVRITARKLDALILDPDTLEVRDEASFTENRLRAATANVASQVTVVPFPYREGANRTVRLATRGMRRFGTVDLELTDLPLDPTVLQRATDLLYGIAFMMVKTAEVDRKGFALEVEELLTVHWRDVEQAYRETPRELSRCEGCPENLEFHLVERPRLPSDPEDHVVAQIVAPRTTSDPANYDHAAWVRRALIRMFGP